MKKLPFLLFIFGMSFSLPAISEVALSTDDEISTSATGTELANTVGNAEENSNQNSHHDPRFCPGPGYIWSHGHWKNHENDNHEWKWENKGRWVKRPNAKMDHKHDRFQKNDFVHWSWVSERNND